MAVVTIPYKPRAAFIPYHNRQQRFASIVAHRRAGKTVAAINDQLRRALTFTAYPNGRFAYVAPFRQQAKDVAWTYLKEYTAPLPGLEVSESELHVTLPNGARIRLYGSDNYDAMRGIYLDGVIMDEYADHHPQAWREVIRPALADRTGWATFIGTAKGKNAFYDIQTKAEGLPQDWYAVRLKASETGLLPDAELQAMRATMTANEYRREMECDFDAAIEGAYYADLIAEARKEGRIGRVAADPLLRLRAYVDIGGVTNKADAFALWVVQFVGREIRLLNHYEAVGQQLSAHVEWLHSQGYVPGKIDIRLPHDGASHKGPYAGSWETAFRDAGYQVSTIIGSGSGGAGAPMIRIKTAQRLFPRMWFDEQKTASGLAALAAYHERMDEKRGVGLGPEHDWSSHSADAFGTMAVDYDEPATPRKVERARVAAGGWMG